MKRESAKEIELIEKARHMATTYFTSRADLHDKQAVFPIENFKNLKDENFLALLAAEKYGGYGISHANGNINTQWQVTKEFGKADMAFSRCWEGHSNGLLFIDQMANEEQKERWFHGVISEGHIWTAWSGEPQKKKPGQKLNFGTQIKEVDSGYVVSGTKIFCTSAPGADWAILFVSLSGPGGARHNRNDSDVIMLACALDDESITFDDSWWDPIGMRGSVSYLVKFNETFIPRENLIGYPGQYLKEDWQVKITPQYAATFLGGAEAALAYTMEYLNKQDRSNDPYVQHRIAQMAMNVQTGNMWLQKTSDHWGRGEVVQAKLSSNICRYKIEQLAVDTVQHAIHICGARSMIRPSVLERILRDMTFYTRHDNHDQVLATIGKAVLGKDHDASFFNGENEPSTKDQILFNPQKTT